MNIAIKIPAPKWDSVHEWGDYHLALGLKKEFEKIGCKVLVQILPEWDTNDDARCDVVLVLRGLSKYNPKNHHFNIMWNISHPDKIQPGEYDKYDYVLTASDLWTSVVRDKAIVPVDTMLQCTDPELFYPDRSSEYNHELLFVGNSRKVFRKIIKDLVPTARDLSIYGTNWKNIVDDRYIRGEHIPNNRLRKAYSSCRILLNDHWDDMRENGFVSNRIFDGFAAGAFILSDDVRGAGDVFGEALVTYNTPNQLRDLIEYYLENDDERERKARQGRAAVTSSHTFQDRANCILGIIEGHCSSLKTLRNIRASERPLLPC